MGRHFSSRKSVLSVPLLAEVLRGVPSNIATKPRQSGLPAFGSAYSAGIVVAGIVSGVMPVNPDCVLQLHDSLIGGGHKRVWELPVVVRLSRMGRTLQRIF